MATVLKYGDVRQIESGFNRAPVGLYTARVSEVTGRQSKNGDVPMAEIQFELVKDADGKKLKESYALVYHYVPLDTSVQWAWRLKEVIVAFGLKQQGGNIATIKGKECLVRLKEDTDQNGDYSPRIGKVLKASAVEEAEEEDEVEDEEETDLDSMDRKELRAFIKDNDLDIKVLKSKTDDDLRDEIREALEEEAEDEDEEEDEEEEVEDEDEDETEAEEDEDNYDDLSVAELKAECKDRELKDTGSKKVMIARLRKDDMENPV